LFSRNVVASARPQEVVYAPQQYRNHSEANAVRPFTK